MAASREVTRLAAELVRLQGKVRTLETAPQLAHSSLDGGAVRVYDPVEGTLRAEIGELPDGSVGVLPVNGPPPPAPSLPTCMSTPRGWVATWDGFNADGTDVQPLDWARLEVHSSTTGEEFSATPGTLRGTIETPQGGSYTYATDAIGALAGTHYVRFVARNTSGAASAASATATIALGKVEEIDVADLSLTVTKFNTAQHLIY